LLEGLEISEIFLSEMNFENRLDSEFYQKLFIKTDRFLKSKKDFEIGTNFKVTDGEHGNVIFRENGIKYLGAENIKNGYVDISKIKYVDESVNQRNLRAEVKIGDILISIKGTLGEIAIAEKWLLPANMSRDVAILKPLNNSGLSSYLLSTFLMTKYGNIQSRRGGSGGVQQMITLGRLRKFIVPKFPQILDEIIKELYLTSLSKRVHSKQTYTQAENLLLEELGLLDFEPSKEAVNIKSLADSFAISGRLDAEYYQKKYEGVVNTVKNKPFDVLSNLVEIRKSIEPGSKNYEKEGLPFMRVADLSKNGLSEPQKYISSLFVKDNQDKINDLKPKKGTILFSKDGSVGIAYHLRQDYNGITSGAILHLNVKDEKRVIPEYLTLALNSKVVQMQAERDAGGSIILHWRSSEIENVVVPIVDYKKQEQIADLIEQSFTLKKESEQLLEVAKRAVEIAIEESEKVALKYINNNKI